MILANYRCLAATALLYKPLSRKCQVIHILSNKHVNLSENPVWLKRVAFGFWALFLIVVIVKCFVAPHIHSVYPAYASAGRVWWFSDNEANPGIYGPFFGTVAFLGLKDLVSAFMTRWELAVGIFTIIVCFYFKGGVWGTIQTIGAKIKAKKGGISTESPS